jgi:hypothetical protein
VTMRNRINPEELLERMLERFEDIDTAYSRTSGLFIKFKPVLRKIEAIFNYLQSIR